MAAERLVVIPEAADAVFTPRCADEVETVRIRYGLPEDYLLWVGGMRVPDPRKRVAALARTSRTLPLVLAGPAGQWAHELPDVHLTGAVSDDELAALYTGAHALVFPSDDEGFGLPPLEALACGTPVAACDVPALREVLGDRIPFVDVGDLEQLVRVAEGLTRPAPRRRPGRGPTPRRPPGASTRRRSWRPLIPAPAGRRAAAPAAPGWPAAPPRLNPRLAAATPRHAAATRRDSRPADGARAAAHGRGRAAS